MLNQNTTNNQSLPKEKQFNTRPNRDLSSEITGQRAAKMSVPIYPFIVDWQLTETEQETESSQVQ